MSLSSDTSLSLGKNVGKRTDTMKIVSSTNQFDCPHTPCFVEGTEIATNRGLVAIEDLRFGDRVLTRDNGYKPIRWIGARHFDAAALEKFPQLRPVTILAGAFGPEVPVRDLTVSPQHRMLVTDLTAEHGETEVLVAAVDLRSGQRSAQTEVTYYHIMFDAHEIVSGNGCWSESFLPEVAALDGLHSAQLTEILTIFPELATASGLAEFAPARFCFTPHKRSALVLAA